MSAALAFRIRQELSQHPGQEFTGTQDDLAQILGVGSGDIATGLKWARDNCLTNQWTVTFNRGRSYRLIDTFTVADLKVVLGLNSELSSTVYDMTVRRNKQVQLMVNRAVTPGTATHLSASRAVQFLSSAGLELLAAATVIP